MQYKEQSLALLVLKRIKSRSKKPFVQGVVLIK